MSRDSSLTCSLLVILTGATVEPFGSFVSNLFTRQGDLDISVQLPNGSYISAAGKKRKQALLGDLLMALRQKGECCCFVSPLKYNCCVHIKICKLLK